MAGSTPEQEPGEKSTAADTAWRGTHSRAVWRAPARVLEVDEHTRAYHSQTAPIPRTLGTGRSARIVAYRFGLAAASVLLGSLAAAALRVATLLQAMSLGKLPPREPSHTRCGGFDQGRPTTAAS